MDYSTQLQHEKHVSKELALRLGEQEEELNDTRQEVLLYFIFIQLIHLFAAIKNK